MQLRLQNVLLLLFIRLTDGTDFEFPHSSLLHFNLVTSLPPKQATPKIFTRQAGRYAYSSLPSTN